MLVQASLGHPYLIQLLGYHLVDRLNELGVQSPHNVTSDEVRTAVTAARSAYDRRALKPLVDELSPLEKAYLRAMVATMDERHVARTANVAAHLSKEPSQLSRARSQLLRTGTIVSPLRGEVRFNIPYLREYIQRQPRASKNVRLVEEWDL